MILVELVEPAGRLGAGVCDPDDACELCDICEGVGLGKIRRGGEDGGTALIRTESLLERPVCDWVGV